MTEVAMSLSLYALTCGHLEGEFGRFMEGGEGNITVPIPVFLIEHPKGRALFDTGLHPDCQYDAAGRLGERMTNLFKISCRPGEEVSARLEAIDRDPARIDLVINSHFHFDHVGGNALIPNATMLVQHREWDASMDPDTAARHVAEGTNALAEAGGRALRGLGARRVRPRDHRPSRRPIRTLLAGEQRE
jgi:glyoxylase-like metal-dependent hydrolase (beta-lactamase superfamily II)